MKVFFDLVLDGGGVLSFEWSDEEDMKNREKHGMSFGEAAEIFRHDVLMVQDDSACGERRYVSFGRLGPNDDAFPVLSVVHVDRGGSHRLTGARKATKRERREFNAYIAKTHY